MNSSDFEDWLKNSVEEEDFSPNEKGWSYVQQKLSANKDKRRILPAYWMRVAASFLLFAMSLSAGIYLYKENKQIIHSVRIKDAETIKLADTTTTNATSNTIAKNKTVTTESSTLSAKRNSTRRIDSQNEKTLSTVAPKKVSKDKKAVSTISGIIPALNTVAKTNLAATKADLITQEKNRDTILAMSQSPTQQDPKQIDAFKNNFLVQDLSKTTVLQKEQANKSQEKSLNSNTINKNTLYPSDDKKSVVAKTKRSSLNIGFSLNAGRADIGNNQYRMGILIHKELSDLFFFETNVGLSTTQVRYSENYNYTSRATPSGTPIVITEEINFSNDIVSTGLSPVFGIKASNRFSIDMGVDLIRNINTRLSTRNNDSIAALINSGDPIMTRDINSWNIGLVNHVNYNLNKNLGLNLSFRYGVSNYLENNNSFRNTGLGLGIKYRFSK